MNTLQNRYKIHSFALTTSLSYGNGLQFGMTVASGFLQCVQSNRLCTTFAEKSSNVCLFSFC